MTRLSFLLFLTLVGIPSDAVANTWRGLMEQTFRNGIVKIGVTGQTAVYETDANGKDKNICVSEGTGFVLNRRHVVTADHVTVLDPRCGNANIRITSRRHKIEMPATKIAGRDDVAILSFAHDLPTGSSGVCSLKLRQTDSHNEDALRFGIPGGMLDPVPLESRTESPGGQFAPKVVLTPSNTSPGESGAPIIVMINVVGILSDRVPSHGAVSLMTPSQTILKLMREFKMEEDIYPCEFTRYATQIEQNGNVRGTITFTSLAGANTASVSEYRVVALKNSAQASLTRVPNDTLLKFANPDTVFSASGLQITTNSTGPVPPSVLMGTGPRSTADANKAAVTTLINDIQQGVNKFVWESYLTEAKTKGLIKQ